MTNRPVSSTPDPLGFILQPTYSLKKGRPVVHLWGRLETGESFLVKDDRQVPYFYVREVDVESARRRGAARMVPTKRRSLAGDPLVRVELGKPSDTPPLRNRLKSEGIECFEADVRFAMRYLINRGIRGAVKLEGEWESAAGIGRVYRNPLLSPARWKPRLSVLSIDIETDPGLSRLLSIALVGPGVAEALLLTPEGYSAPQGAVPFSDEKQLLEALIRRIRELDPDVITGWNVVDFDLWFLQKRAAVHGLNLAWGRGGGSLRLRRSRTPWSSHEAIIPGRVVLDGIDLLRGAFVRMEQYTLDFVARRVLGEGKTIEGHDRADAILHSFENDRLRFVEYNLTDARLVLEILEKLHLIDLALERSLLTGLPVDRVAASIAAFDFLYLSELHKRQLVAPSVGSSDTTSTAPGGYVFTPDPGLYENVLVFDFKSLYPSLIRTFNIDPLRFVDKPQPGDDVLICPNGAAFGRRPGILPHILDELFPRREAAQQAGDKVASHAIKILMNSFYGVLGTPACRFFHPQLAGAVTSLGQKLLLWSRGRLENYGYRVIYGDTDSLFVSSGEEQASLAWIRGQELSARLNQDLSLHLEEQWGVESRLELELEKLYRKLHLPPVRGGQGGARKRYVGLLQEEGKERIHFVGMEVVRRDWTELAKQAQRELYRRLFAGEEMEDYLEQLVRRLRAGELDDLLIYYKSLRKPLDAYTTTTPPHVAAARKLKQPPGRLISYLMTRAGPEPAEERSSPLDYEHYVRKQLRPVAFPILQMLGLNFEKVIGDDAQLELF